MLIAPQQLGIRGRSWCLWKEGVRLYNTGSRCVKDMQKLKDISLFEVDGVFLEGRFWW
jgi:hypothetical protein